MAKRKKWTAEEVQFEQSIVEEPEISQPIAEPRAPLTLEQAKAIVNDAVQPPEPGRDARLRPPLDLLTEAKAVVNAAVQPKAPV